MPHPDVDYRGAFENLDDPKSAYLSYLFFENGIGKIMLFDAEAGGKLVAAYELTPLPLKPNAITWPQNGLAYQRGGAISPERTPEPSSEADLQLSSEQPRS